MLLLTTLLSQKTWSRNLWPCFWPVAPFDPSTACRTLNEQEILLSSGNLKCEISVVGKPWSRLPRTNLVNLRRRGGPHARQQRWNLQSNHAWELSADAAACHSQLGAVQIGRPRLHCWERGGHWIQQIPLVRSAIVSTKSWPYKGDTLLITQKQLGPSLISGNALHVDLICGIYCTPNLLVTTASHFAYWGRIADFTYGRLLLARHHGSWRSRPRQRIGRSRI